MKTKWFFTLMLSLFLCLTMTSCGSAYEIKPGEQSDFDIWTDGAKIVATEIEGKINGDHVVQQPASFFLKEARGTSPTSQGADYVYASGAEAYMKMLTEKLGFELFHESLGYVYNTWYFIRKGSNKVTGDYGTGYDVMVRHYYDASTSSTKDWIDVTLDEELYVFGDLGYRAKEEYTRAEINGTYARDAIHHRRGYYYNFSDSQLRVKSGVKEETLYTYTKPFASKFYGFYGYEGRCGLIINGGEVEEYDALISDYEDFNSDNTDMIFLSKSDGSKLLGITWKHKEFEVGGIYNLSDFTSSSYREFYFNYDYNEFDENDALCLTVRPIWIDRTGAGESVVYFYGEFIGDSGDIYTVEGLLAAPFCLEETSEKYTGNSSGGGGGYAGVPDADDPYIPDHSKLDCLTCGGDGDCNTCHGYGEVERYAGAGDYVTAKCSSCYGSGNCRTCGGSGKRN